MKTLSYAVLFCALLSGCGSEIKRDIWVEFALSTPSHLTDWQQIRNRLQVQGIECSENGSSVGTFSCSIPAPNFAQAKRIAADVISSESLTVRIKKEENSDLFEVYTDGKKLNEESYTVR
jgi:hypothetical protein